MYRIILERFLSFNLTTPSSQYCFLFAVVFSPVAHDKEFDSVA